MAVEKRDIFPPGSLPGGACHASSLVLLPTGEILAAWWAGTREKAPDASIWGARFDPELGQWSPPEVIANTPGRFNGTPVWYLAPDDTLYLFFRAMHHGRVIKAGHSVTTILYRTSRDHGRSWGPARYLWKWWFRVIRCLPLRLPTGRVLLPFHRELGTYQARFFVNDDPNLAGKWRTRGRLKVPKGCLEPTLCLTPRGTVVCGLRTTRAGRVYLATSDDMGESWTQPTRTEVPNPNAQVDLLATRDGPVIMAANPVAKGRGELAVVPSPDEGRTWDLTRRLVVERDPGAEFSYPCVLQTADDRIHLSYTNRRRTITHCVLDPAELSS